MRLYNYWRSSSSYRVRLALALKELPYEYVAVNLLQGAHREAAFRALNPSGSVPLLELASATPGSSVVRIGQSVAIAEYLEERYPERPLLPSLPEDRAHVRSMVELVTSGIQPFHNLETSRFLKETLRADPAEWNAHFIGRGLAQLEELVAARAGRYAFGDAPTLADCWLVPQLYGARRFGVDTSSFPALSRVERACLDLPAFQAATPERQPDAVTQATAPA